MKTVEPMVSLLCSHDDDFQLRHEITFCVMVLFRMIINNCLFLLFCNLH